MAGDELVVESVAEVGGTSGQSRSEIGKMEEVEWKQPTQRTRDAHNVSIQAQAQGRRTVCRPNRVGCLALTAAFAFEPASQQATC